MRARLLYLAAMGTTTLLELQNCAILALPRLQSRPPRLWIAQTARQNPKFRKTSCHPPPSCSRHVNSYTLVDVASMDAIGRVQLGF